MCSFYDGFHEIFGSQLVDVIIEDIIESSQTIITDSFDETNAEYTPPSSR